MPHPKTLNKSIINEYFAMREAWLMANIKLDLTASPAPVAICRVCKAKVDVPNSDQFVPYSVFIATGTAKARHKQLKTNKAVLLWFQDEHWERCEKTHEFYFEQQIKALSKF